MSSNTVSSAAKFQHTQFRAVSPKASPNLDRQQELKFESKIDHNFVFLAKNQSFQFPFNLKDFFNDLMESLKAKSIDFEDMYLYGSQMVDILLKVDRVHTDIDFIIPIRSRGNPYELKEIFLETMIHTFFRSTNQAPLPGFNKDAFMDIFCGALDTLGVHSNIIPITIPVSGFKIDITFIWDTETTCSSSANCYRGGMRNWLEGGGRLNCFSAADGYEPTESLELLKKGFFFVQPGRPEKIRDSLRGYINTITSGVCPIDYTIEQEYLEKWLKEFPTSKNKEDFLGRLVKHFAKHYNQNQFMIAAYLLNMRAFFQAQEYEGKQGQ